MELAILGIALGAAVAVFVTLAQVEIREPVRVRVDARRRSRRG